MPGATARQQLDTFLNRYTDDIAATTRAALRHMRRRVPGATELVYDNYNALGIGFGPSDRAAEIVFSIVAYPRWVTLFFLRGATLSDPAKLLKGNGTRVRHIVLDSPERIGSTEVDALLEQALKRAKVNINPAARRALVIKSISERQRPRQPTGRGAAPKARAAVRRPAKSGVDYDTVRQVALALPQTRDTSTLRGVSFKARGKLITCKAIHRSAEPESLVVRVGNAARDRLLRANPAAFYLTPHYEGSESVLARLNALDRKSLHALFGLAWNFVTSKARTPARRKPPGRL